MKKILLDTNFLLIPGQFKVDIFSEFNRICDFNFRLYVLDRSIEELKNIAKQQRGRHKESPKLALHLIEAKRLDIIKTGNINKNTDDLILDIAKEQDFIVATQDKRLKGLLRDNKVKTIILRQKKHLRMD